MTEEILSAEQELPAPLMSWIRTAAKDPDREYRSANSLLQAARDAGVAFRQSDYVTGVSRKAPALALYRYLRTLHHENHDIDEWFDVAPASLDTAEQNLEQVGNASTLEEGPAYATVAMAHALVVLAKTLDRQNQILASLARTVDKMHSLALSAYAVTDGQRGGS
jgi:hypothetical protein